MLKFAFLAGSLLSLSPAVAQTQAPATQKAAPAAKDESNRMICETEEQIGSRLAARRVCMTATQWKEHEQSVHQQLDQQHSTVQPTGGPG